LFWIASLITSFYWDFVKFYKNYFKHMDDSF